MSLSRFQSTFRLLCGLAAVVLFCGAASAAGVRQFSPQGQVDQQVRATAVFSADMVPLGRPDAPPPFSVDCGEVKGKGRWGDARSWSYALERPLQPGERCDFRLKSNLKAANGEAVSGESSYAFFAPGPWPRSLTPRPGGAIEEDQAFIIEASGALKRESVERNVWCEADGVGNRIPVRILDDATRNAILATLHVDVQPGTLAIACSERLPAGAKMRLVWGKGVEADNGAKSSRNESFHYVVREPFRASFSCEREKPNAPCSPLSDLRIEFSVPVDSKKAGSARLVSPEGARSPMAPNQEGDRENTVQTLTFKRPFPQNAELKIELPSDIKDEAGRPLSNAASFPLKVRTGSLPPLAKFPGAFGIVELKEGGVVPVTLRNVEVKLPVVNLQLPAENAHRFTAQRLTDDAEVIAAIKALAKFEQQTRLLKIGKGKEAHDYEDPYYARELPFLKGKAGVLSRELPKPGGSTEFEVVGIPLQKPGYHIVEIESRLLGAALLSTPAPMYVRTSVLVTNLAVHLKRGKDNALVWVTALDSGKPVAGAEVRVSNCDGKSLWQGRSDDAGRALVDVALPESSCDEANFIFASARLGEDYSFVRSDWNEGIEAWRFGVETWGETEALKIHTIFDRTLFRAGQTVSMKHIARERNSRSFAFPEAQSLPTELVIRHDGSGDEFRQPLSWDSRGVATNQWKIPESAKRGAYQVELRSAPNGRGGSAETGRFSVSDFRLPVFAGSVQGVPGRLVAPKEVPLVLGLSFLNGGAAKGAKVEVSATLRPRWPEYKGYDGFNFQVDFDEQGRSAFAVDDGREREQLLANRLPVTLDQAGSGKLSVPLPAKVKGPSELYAEMTFADPNGEIQTVHGSVELSPASLVAGIHVKDWASVKESGKVEIVVLDTQGKPVADAPVKVNAKRRIDYSHRKRIVGGFYAYENHTEFVDMGEVCKGRTDSRGKFLCEPRSSEPGNVYLLAETRDKAGNLAFAGTSYWVTGGGDLWFTAGNQDRIDVIPEKRSYAPGETARFQVRTPFREATALVSVEAGGIIETQVVPLSRFKPVIELPVKGEWGPNVFVSVLVVRGRVEPLKWYSLFTWGWREPTAWFKEWWNPLQPTAMVDLAKPAYKLGLATIEVGVEAFKLKVEVTPEKADYQPRDKAQVKIRVTQPDGKPVPAGTEIAFAAVDQALLELRPNESWKLPDAMLPTRAYQVETATAQSQVIGKRHYGKKAVPPGGGGGRAPARELFDTLLLWDPRVVLDATGSATITVPLNDSLSEFKLVAVADAGAGLFGSGSASLRTRQDLQLISGLPPLVREKDRYSALLTLRNGTAKAMVASVSAKAGERSLETKEVKLEAESAAELVWPADAPEGETSLVWEFAAFDIADKSGTAKDRLRITQQVAPAVPITVQQATFARIDGKLELPVALPSGAVSGKSGPLGGIEVALSARLSTPPPGLKRFFEEYPFVCLEQKTSVAIGLRDAARWQQVVEAMPTYLDSNGLARYFPGEGSNGGPGNAGSPALTAYLLDASHAAAFAIPPELAQRMERGLAAFAEGRIKPEHWSPQSDLVVRKLSAIEALTRRGQSPLSAISSLEIEPLRLPTSALIDWYLVAKRLTKLPDRAGKLAAAEREIRNRLSYLGGRLTFTSERSDFWWWLMVSGDANAFRLIEAVVDDPAWKDDLPALVQGAMLRQQRGRWLTTVANVWATIALDKFGRQFERDAVSGNTHATLGALPLQNFTWLGKTDEINKLLLPWPSKNGATDKLQLIHEGSGKPWAAMQVLAAVPVKEPKANGFRVTREVTPVQEKQSGKVSRGDVWRVRLTVESDQEMSWVVLSDPIPGGARILGEGDGRDSHIAGMGEKEGAKGENKAWPTYVERTFSAYRAYYGYVPRGKFYIDYTLRLNNAGEFSLPATRVEAMYAPEVFGEIPNGKVVVGE
ncbi:alpha-2-macroglobulin family protein [Propionivibrio sp.]|uniref:alpha-2-macroglobulin family protein n=1 Tax=Propionivibrio sp. TaxID=2212460 RepID=UPI003BF146F5